MDVLIWIAVFAFSIVVLLKSADYFINSASKIGVILGVPQFLVGISIVALGTSLPELVTSLFAVFSNSTEFISGNVVGSNIANILLVIGITAIIAKRIVSKWDLVNIDIPILIASTVLLIFVLIDGKVDWIEGIILLLGYAAYVYYFFEVNVHHQKPKVTVEHTLLIYIILFCSGLGLYLGAQYTMKSIIMLTQISGLPDTSFLGATVVGLATSLPELIVTISAIRKHNVELAFGNVLGSNIFNATVVLAIPSFFGALVVSPSIITVGIPFIIASVALFAVITLDKKINRYESLFLILLYIMFLVSMFRI